jgi:hypothetical protein
MRRWYAALGVAVICLVFTIGASSPDAVAVFSSPNAAKLLAATAVVTQPTIVAAPLPQTPAPAFGSYAVISLETMIAAALLCYAFLQRRRVTNARRRPRFVRRRGPPLSHECMLLAP